MTRTYQKKIASIFIIGILIIGLNLIPQSDNVKADETCIIDEKIEFEKPIIKNIDNFLDINIKKSNSRLAIPGSPNLPVVVKKYELPWGTKIQDLQFKISDFEEQIINKKITPVPRYNYKSIELESTENTFNPVIYEKNNFYPDEWLSISKGCGINKFGENVLHLSIKINPVRYNPVSNTIKSISKIEFTISYNHEEIEESSITEYDFVIIAPEIYHQSLKELVEHKQEKGFKTTLSSAENIYKNGNGRDNPEKIKNHIKNCHEKYMTDYFLLVGDIKKVPIRSTDAYPWGNAFGGNILSDLYYADLYDENFSFNTWDKNDNDIFGEVEYKYDDFPPEMNNIDGVDLYPDVYLGRLPCKNVEEVTRIVKKIINYEEFAYDQLWFKKIILAGGDTFPLTKGSKINLFEGEITNQKVIEVTPDFQHIKLWASKRNLNALRFNQAINKGAGFLTYAGHGFEHGWGTYRPNAILDGNLIIYYTPFLQFLRNNDKLPIIFFDACLTAKLDFNMSDIARYYPKLGLLYKLITGNTWDESNYLPCFAWAFINQEKGGAIATIGATRPAYTWVDENGVYAGAGYLDVHFFKAYEEGITVSQMFTQSQNDYINNVGKDYFTIEEYMLLGDPTLMVGGYP